MTRDGNNLWLHLTVVIELSKLNCRLISVHYRHRQVHENETVADIVALGGLNLLKTVLSIFGRIKQFVQVLKRAELDHVFQCDQVKGLVIDQQYAALGMALKNGGDIRNLFLFLYLTALFV